MSFHYRDPAKTPVLREVFKAIYRRPDDFRRGLSSLEIEEATRLAGHKSVRAASDVSELRRYFEDHGNTHYVPDAVYDRTIKSGSRVSLFVIYRWDDPRAVEARKVDMARAERLAERKAA